MLIQKIKNNEEDHLVIYGFSTFLEQTTSLILLHPTRIREITVSCLVDTLNFQNTIHHWSFINFQKCVKNSTAPPKSHADPEN